MRYILVIATNAGSKTVSIEATSSQEALAAYTPNVGEIILSVEPEWQKIRRDAVTTEKAHRDAHLWRRHSG